MKCYNFHVATLRIFLYVLQEVVVAVRSADKQALKHLLFEDLPCRDPHARPCGWQMAELADMIRGMCGVLIHYLMHWKIACQGT